jgi:hypothetical protein
MKDTDQLAALRRRLDRWLIAQTEHLLNVDSPFPLAIMTCVGCEAAGQLFYGEHNREAEGTQRDCFIAICGRMDQRLSRRFPKDFQERLQERWPAAKLQDCTTAADVIYRFFRNSLIHGYRGQGVYLTADETPNVDLGNGFLKLNPLWFWNRFRDRHTHLWEEVEHSEENNPRHLSALAYLKELFE